MEQIQSFIAYIESFNLVTVLLRLLLAVIAGGIIGSERGRHGRAAGLRTHILICLGGAMTALLTKVEHKRKQAVRFYIEVDTLEKIQQVLNEIGVILHFR